MRSKQAELDRLKEQQRELVEDEKRIRDNLALVGLDSAFYKQSLDKLGDTEAMITALSSAMEKAAADIETAKAEVERFIPGLAL